MTAVKFKEYSLWCVYNTTDSNGEKMLKIAICDDEKVFRDNINK